MNKSKSAIYQVIIATCGAFVSVFGLWQFNQNYLMLFSLPWRIVLMFVTQWLLLLVPVALMLINKEKLSDIGFSKEKIPLQIVLGLLLALALTLVITVLPILLGFKDMVGSTSYTKTWQFAFEFFYATFAVALAEETIFRGYLFHKLLEIKNSKWFAIIISSALFGLFHVFNGDIIQIFITTLLGIIFCVYREKIKGATLLSFIVAHGVHNALIILWVAVL